MSEMIFSAWPLLMAPAPTDGSQPPAWVQLLPLVILFVLMYFVLLRPQMKRQKEQKAMIEALAKGDEVVTAGGVLGRITKMGDSIVHVEVASGIELQIQRASVAQVLPKGTLK